MRLKCKVYMCGEEKKRKKEKKKRKKCVWMKTNKEIKGKNKIKKCYCGAREFITPAHFMLRPKACAEDTS